MNEGRQEPNVPGHGAHSGRRFGHCQSQQIGQAEDAGHGKTPSDSNASFLSAMIGLVDRNQVQPNRAEWRER
jgi:hypothetical protein